MLYVCVCCWLQTGARTATQDGLETHMGTNHLGHFLLTLGLLPCLQLATAAATPVPDSLLGKPWPPGTATAAAATGAGNSSSSSSRSGDLAISSSSSLPSTSSGPAAAADGSDGSGSGGGGSSSSTQQFRARVVNVVSAMEMLAYDLTKEDVMLANKGAYGPAKSYGRSKFAQVGRSRAQGLQVPVGIW